MTNQLAIQLIEQDEEALNSLYEERQIGAFLVDWREADDDIILLAAEAIDSQELYPGGEGDELCVCYKNQMTLVPLEWVPGEQDKTLLALNKALFPDYEIRYIKASEGSDTLAFMILGLETWKNLESTFGAKVDEAFMKLTASFPLFG